MARFVGWLASRSTTLLGSVKTKSPVQEFKSSIKTQVHILPNINIKQVYLPISYITSTYALTRAFGTLEKVKAIK